MGDQPSIESETIDSEAKRRAIIERNNSYDKLSLFSLIASDAKKYGGIHFLVSVGFYVSLIYRLGHFFERFKLGILIKPFQAIITIFTFCRISPKATIGPGLVLWHPTNVYICPRASIGRDCNIGPRTFISITYYTKDMSGFPVIADGVSMAVGSVVMGKICVEEGVIIGPNVVVMKNIPEFCSVPSPVARSIVRVKDGWE